MRYLVARISIIICFMIISFLNVYAQVDNSSNNDSEVIVEEETPEISASIRNTWIVIYGVTFVLAIIYASSTVSAERKKFALSVMDVEDIGDGSFVVKVGFQNLTKRNQEINRDDAKIIMKDGKAIILERKNISCLFPSTKQELITLAISDDSNVEIIIDGEKIKINKNLIENWRNEE